MLCLLHFVSRLFASLIYARLSKSLKFGPFVPPVMLMRTKDLAPKCDLELRDGIRAFIFCQ